MPFFWYKPRGLFSTLFSPLGWLYGKGGKILRSFKTPQHFSVPIISIGNIVSGGSGKTPTAIALAGLLQKKGFNVHLVTRGYKGSLKGPIEVNSSYHKPTDVGDEPLLLAQHAPTWVAKNRPLGVHMAQEKGADIVILDDGHQTHSLFKDISFIVIDLLQGFGNECIIPAGPLREDLVEGLKRASALIEIGEGKMSSHLPSFKTQSVTHPTAFSSNICIAFCGLGFPEKFFKTLENLGMNLLKTCSFPDHYGYKDADILKLYTLAKEREAILITTRKDWIKLSPYWQEQVHVLDISIQFEKPDEVYEFILDKIPALKEKM